MTKTDFIEAMKQEIEGMPALQRLESIDHCLNYLVMNSKYYVGAKSMLDMFMKDENASFSKTYSQVCEFLGVKLSPIFFKHYLKMLPEYPSHKAEEMVQFFIESKGD